MNSKKNEVWEKFKTFLIAFTKGMLLALLWILPWLMRLVAVLLWLTGGALLMDAVHRLYAPFSQEGEVVALQFAVIFLMVAWAGVALRRGGNFFWGSLAVSGIVPTLLIRYALPWFLDWRYGDLIVRILPPALFALGLMYLTFRFRLLRKKGVSHE